MKSVGYSKEWSLYSNNPATPAQVIHHSICPAKEDHRLAHTGYVPYDSCVYRPKRDIFDL